MQEPTQKIPPQPSQHTLNPNPITHDHEKKDFLLTASLGGIAGLLMEGVLHPIDTIRTRLKANTKTYVPFLTQVAKMYRNEGHFSYFRGLTCTLWGSFISNASYFWIYEKLKYILNKDKILSESAAPFLAAFVGGFTSDFIYLPFDVVRTRMQLKPGVYDYKNFTDGFRKIIRHEGVTTLYLGGPVFFTLSGILTSLTFGFYEIFHKALKPFFSTEHEVNIPLSITSSVLAASLAAFVTNPLDVLVTRMQSVNTTVQDPYTIKGLVKKIYKNEGLTGFMKGVSGTVTYYAISSIILFPTYELLKAVFHVDLSED